jgi:hypothetical protein
MSAPRNSYSSKCDERLNVQGDEIFLETIEIADEINIATKKHTKDQFCHFLQENQYGIKTFGNLRELIEEHKKIKAFIPSFKDKLEFLKLNTCFAFSKTKDNEIYTVAKGM